MRAHQAASHARVRLRLSEPGSLDLSERLVQSRRADATKRHPLIRDVAHEVEHERQVAQKGGGRHQRRFKRHKRVLAALQRRQSGDAHVRRAGWRERAAAQQGDQRRPVAHFPRLSGASPRKGYVQDLQVCRLGYN